MNTITAARAVFLGVLVFPILCRGGILVADAFSFVVPSHRPSQRRLLTPNPDDPVRRRIRPIRRPTTETAGGIGIGVALQLARKYIVIGGDLEGINSNVEEESTYNMSKKERRKREREGTLLPNKKPKMKKKLGVNYDKLEERVTRERTPLPREMKTTTTTTKKMSSKAKNLMKQRTAGGTVNSTAETTVPQSPETQAIEIRVAKRGNKTVTMVQGMTLPMEDRRVLLKEMKAKLGGGGTLVDGVLELQGMHADKILAILKTRGYAIAKVVGGGGASKKKKRQ